MSARKKAYVFGPMTGIPEYNLPAFMATKLEFESLGYEVVTPFDLNTIVWQRHYGTPFRPGIDKCDYGDPLLCEMFAEDVRAVCEADVLIALHGWERSRGSRIEAQIGVLFGKEFMWAESHESFIPVFTVTIGFEGDT